MQQKVKRRPHCIPKSRDIPPAKTSSGVFPPSKNIVEMGLYAVQQYRLLQQDFPHLITGVTGTGLLYAVQLNENVFKVVAYDGAEYVLRKQGKPKHSIADR